ncbi:MAG TPA: amidohydrolase family protein [Caulobacteraceae bacterium]|nr:amidohydrolase family protein [Caulobacteraceae bacterium]
MRGLAVLALALLTPASAWATPPARDLAIVGATVYATPEAAPVENATVVVHNGRIVAVGPKVRPPKGAEVIEAKGQVVTAGFWNSHVHLISPTDRKEAKAPAAALNAELQGMLTRWGFTTVFDIASGPGDAIAIRGRIASGEVTGPNILTVDMPFYPKNGTPIYVRELAKTMPSCEISDPASAAERARRQIAAGANGVKLFTGAIVGPPQGILPMKLDDAKAVVAAAHALGKPAFTHPSNNIGLNVAIDAGVDILAHTTPDGGPWPADMAGRLKAHNMALIPTLTLWHSELDKQKAPKDRIDRFEAVAQGQLKAYSDIGGQILFGTDVGYTDVFDTTEEYRLMAGAGLTWRQILAALTTAPAQRFGFPKKGKVAVGDDGDLVILAADPATNPEAFAKVRATIRAGQVIYRAP